MLRKQINIPLLLWPVNLVTPFPVFRFSISILIAKQSATYKTQEHVLCAVEQKSKVNAPSVAQWRPAYLIQLSIDCSGGQVSGLANLG